ncbi:hypothetical protein NDU88_004244 [Pleurodeles waltl]|uniref:Uncharacterized protein n=1 Tax=Pleurodeles waltl TaxID=8319 RepID=A0AAV7T964_PLEWA|nr:hypothetical protein NDU88_004244 [Pleurodeles waltl]
MEGYLPWSALPGHPDKMGKSDDKQSKLFFDQCRQTRSADSEPEDARPLQVRTDGLMQDSDVSSIFLGLQHSFTAIDTKIDLLTDRFDHLKDKVDKHNEQITQQVTHEKLLQIEQC